VFAAPECEFVQLVKKSGAAERYSFILSVMYG